MEGVCVSFCTAHSPDTLVYPRRRTLNAQTINMSMKMILILMMVFSHDDNGDNRHVNKADHNNNVSYYSDGKHDDDINKWMKMLIHVMVVKLTPTLALMMVLMTQP